MRKKYFVSTLLCAFFISSVLYAFSDKEILPIKQKASGEYYVASTVDPDWSYTCKDGIEVELSSIGLKNSVPTTLNINDLETIDKIVVEIVYKTKNAGESIEIEDDQGNIYTAERVAVPGGNSVWYYRTEIPVTSYIKYSNTTNQAYAQSMLAYVFRRNNNGIGSFGYFTSTGGYNNVKTINVPINTDSGPRTVKLELPISELTDDGRYILIEAYTSDGNSTQLLDVINSFPDGKCCIKIYELTLNNVSGEVDHVNIRIDTRNKQNGQTVNGQSWVMASSIKTEVKCSCVDFDTTPPFANNFSEWRILQNIAEMPEVTFSDDCSGVTVEYNEYELAQESCMLGPGGENFSSNIWFNSFPFDNYHHWEYGYYLKLTDGTSKYIGKAVNDSDPSSGWIIELFFENQVDYNTWISSGGITADDPLNESRMYAAIDFTKSYRIQGFGDYKDSNLTFLTNTSYHHMDVGQRSEYGGYGTGLWVSYEGTVNGEVVGGEAYQHIEGASSLLKCVNKRAIFIVREWIVTDAAGNADVFVQRVEIEN